MSILGSSIVFLSAAVIAYQGSRWADSVEMFRAAGEPDLMQPELLFYYAVALYETGDLAAASATLERCLPALERDPFVELYISRILSQD